MKRGLLLVVLMLVLLPNIYAAISFNEINPKTYNFGDIMNFVGFISRENNFNGLFKVILICKESSIPLMTRTININANEKYNFQEEFTIPNIIEGECNLKSTLEENNNLIEEKLSDLIIITKELKGNFILVNSKVQLGDDVDVRGEIFKVNGKKINGIANVYLKRDKNILFIDTLNIKDGNLLFKIPSNYTSIGEYSIDFNVRDVNSNENSFTEAIKFTITNLLNLEVKLSKDKINPGEEFEINGQVKDIYGKRVNSGSYKIKFDNKEFDGNILLGDISHKIKVDDNIKAGSQNVVVEATDSSGNKGSNSVNIIISAISQRIEINLDKDSYKPGEKIKIKALVYDQGGDLISRDVNIEIKDSSTANKFDQTIKDSVEFILPAVARPGEWIIKARSDDLKAEKKFYISEVKKIAINLQGQTLVVTNTGNVDYNEALNIKLDGVTESLTTSKKVNLEPGESFSLDLGTEAKTGLYKVTINDKIFNNIKIDGDKIVYYKNNSSLIFTISVLIILGILLFLKKRKFFQAKKRNERTVAEYASEVKKMLQNKIEKNENYVKKELQHMKFKPERNYRDYVEVKAKKENLDSFRKNSSYLKRRKEESSFKEGMFNMFK